MMKFWRRAGALMCERVRVRERAGRMEGEGRGGGGRERGGARRYAHGLLVKSSL